MTHVVSKLCRHLRNMNIDIKNFSGRTKLSTNGPKFYRKVGSSDSHSNNFGRLGIKKSTP